MKFKFFLSIMLIAVCSFAQNSGYAGRDFWMTSSGNYYTNSQDSAVLYIVSDTICSGVLENPNTSYFETFSILPNQVNIIKIPNSEIQNPMPDNDTQCATSCFDKGVHLTTSRNVYVYLQNSLYEFYLDTTLYYYNGRVKKCPIIPTSLLTSNLSSFPLNREGIYSLNILRPMYVIATEDTTVITIQYVDGRSGDPIFLNKGQVILVADELTDSNQIKAVFSNCKKFACYGTIYREEVVCLYPVLNSRYFHSNYFIIKKSSNRKFAKSMSFEGIYTYSGQLDISADVYLCDNMVSNVQNFLTCYTSLGDPFVVFRKVECSLTPPFLRDIPYLFIRFNDVDNTDFDYFRFRCAVQFNHRYTNAGSWQHITQAKKRFKNTLPAQLSNGIMVKKWVIPTTRNNVHILNYDIDTTFAELDIYVHENGINTTYLNGQLLPASVFDSVPYTNRDYYVAQFGYYNHDIPEIIRVENVNGFSAYLDEFAYSQVGSNPDSIRLYYYHDNNSGVNFDEAPVEHSNLSPHNNDTVYRCLGDTLLLTVEHNPDSLSFDWIVNGVTHYDTRTLYVPLISLDTLVAQLVINYPCPDTVTTFVVVVPPPVLPFSTDTTVCAGTLLSVEFPAALDYLWSTGDTTPAIRIDSAGIYSVTASNRGCTARLDSFYVSLYAASSVELGPDTMLCALATMLLDAQQPHPAIYEWQDNSTNTSYTVVEDGNYWVVVTDRCGNVSDSINVGYLNDFVLELGGDTLLCEGDELLLSPGIPYCNYVWQDGSSTSSFVVRHPGEYSVTATNHCFTHSDGVSVEYQPCAQELYIPNSFTPDGDGLNDRFAPVFSYPDEVESFEMMVYDRHGGVVYATKDMRMGWDGTGVPQGMYTYIIRYKSARNAEQLVKGTVTLLR